MTANHAQKTDASGENELKRVLENVLVTEVNSIHSVIDKTHKSLAAAVNLVFQSTGPLIVSGVGKSGQLY